MSKTTTSTNQKEEEGLTAEKIQELKNVLSVTSPNTRIVRNYSSKYYGSEFETIQQQQQQSKQLMQGAAAAVLPTQRTPGANRMSQKEIDQLLRVLSLSK